MSEPSRALPILKDADLVTEGEANVQRCPHLLECAQQQRQASTGRRRVLKALSLSAFAAILLPWRQAEAKKVALSLAQVAPLKKVGGSALVTVKGQELLLIRDSETTVHAVDPMCTHKKCKVFYRPKDNDIGCKCHKSRFTLEGDPVSGPAPKPLASFRTKLKGDKIIIKLD